MTVLCLTLFSSADPAVSPASPQTLLTGTSQFLVLDYQISNYWTFAAFWIIIIIIIVIDDWSEM